MRPEESIEAGQVIDAAIAEAVSDHWADGPGDLLGGSRVSAERWLVAVRYAEPYGEAIMTLERNRPAGGWAVSEIVYGYKGGAALRKVFAHSTPAA